jgi:hypothetical protein
MAGLGFVRLADRQGVEGLQAGSSRSGYFRNELACARRLKNPSKFLIALLGAPVMKRFPARFLAFAFSASVQADRIRVEDGDNSFNQAVFDVRAVRDDDSGFAFGEKQSRGFLPSGPVRTRSAAGAEGFA